MAFSDPDKNIEQLSLSDGAVVADLGAGSGFYTMAAAKAVAPSGKVYALDIQQELLSRITKAAHNSGITNIEVVHGDIEKMGGTRIKDSGVDVVIIANVLFQMEDKETFLKEAFRILKSGGRALVVDWADSFGGLGPQPEFVVPMQSARELFEKEGFTFVSSIVAGDHHYGFIFRKK